MSPKLRAFTLPELLVGLLILTAFAGVLWSWIVPRTSCNPSRPHMTMQLANARSLQQATQMMTLDSKQSGKGVQWTTRKVNGQSVPVSLAEFLNALTSDGYITPSDLRKILSPTDRTLPENVPLTAENIAFTIYAIDDASPSDQVFLTSANLELPQGVLRPGIPPGKKGFLFFTKGGGGGIRVRPQDVNASHFPSAPPYRYMPLK